MRVALIGPRQSGKSSLFAAVAREGGSGVHVSHGDQPNLAVVKVPDSRVDWLAGHYKPKKFTHAELEFLDLPGWDLSDQAGRTHAQAGWPAMRQSDMLVFVLRAFESDLVAPYRGRIDPSADLQEIQTELLFADLEQVAARIEKLQAAVRKPSDKKDEQVKELELMNRLRTTLEAEKPIAQAVTDQNEEKLIRSFAFLSQKPALAVINVSEKFAAQVGEDSLGGTPAIRLSAKIEDEMSQLSPDDRAVFLADLGLPAQASDRLIRACYQKMNLITFLTVNENEVRAWTLPAGTDAVTAAGVVHSDFARGFIRAETVNFEDLRAAGDMKAARATGKIRLEGKNYIVRDGDVIFFRFNV